jgi:hypothetical protein
VKENYVYIKENKGTGDAVQGNGHSHKHMLLLCKQMITVIHFINNSEENIKGIVKANVPSSVISCKPL